MACNSSAVLQGRTWRVLRCNAKKLSNATLRSVPTEQPSLKSNAKWNAPRLNRKFQLHYIKSALSYTSELGPVAPPDPLRPPTTSQPPRNVSRTRYPNLPERPQISRLHFHETTSLKISRTLQTEGVGTACTAHAPYRQPDTAAHNNATTLML